MSELKKAACIVFCTDQRYAELMTNVKNSFLTFNSRECDFYQIDENNLKDYTKELKFFELETETFSEGPNPSLVPVAGLMQYIYAYEIMMKYNYEKVIILGTDTIVCSRLDEFLDDNVTPVLATLNYWIHEETEYWSTPIVEYSNLEGNVEIDHMNINADVVCFNSAEALKKVIELSINHYTHFANQGGLNELAWQDKTYEVKIVDFPYSDSKVSYNVRSKGVPRTNMIKSGLIANCWPNNIHGFPQEWLIERGLIDGNPSPIQRWYVKENKLYTHDHKQIKCFHFVEGIGGRPIEAFNELISDFKTKWFNEDTIKFFKETCNCNVFFK